MKYMVSLSVVIEAADTADAFDRVVPAVAAGLQAISGETGYVNASVTEYGKTEDDS